MRAPILVVSDDTAVFDSVQAAERYLEPPDVKDLDVRVYDADGLLLQCVIERRFLANVVRFKETDGPPDVVALRAALVEFINARTPLTRSNEPKELEGLWRQALCFKAG